MYLKLKNLYKGFDRGPVVGDLNLSLDKGELLCILGDSGSVFLDGMDITHLPPEKRPVSMVFVTHDQEEALLLSDKMAIMEQGHLVQFGQPEEIFRNPATPFVGEFLSLSNLRWDPDGTLVKIIKRG